MIREQTVMRRADRMASEFGACRDKLGSDFFAVLGVVRFVETKKS
jgi:hypothetical protein